MLLSHRIFENGPPLLLLHGMGVTYPIWENLLPLLIPYYKLILVELPGHGSSPPLPRDTSFYEISASMIEGLRQELRIDRWSILGYSTGTRVLQEYLMRYPERVERAIYLCPLLAKPACSFALKGLIRIDLQFPWLGSWLLRGWRLHQLVLLFGFNGLEHPDAAMWTREIASQPVEVMKALLKDLPGAGRDPFEISPVPALFIWGDRDRIVESPRWPGTMDRIVKGGHSLPMLAAQDVSKYILPPYH